MKWYSTSETVASPVRSNGPLTVSFAQPPAYVETMIPSIDLLASNASLVPSNQIDCEILLTKCIGHGAAGQVFIGTAGNAKYAIKIAPWKDGKQMLQQEADIYKVLSDLQGRCIPKIYGFFGSEHLKVLIMAYMGHMVGNISDLNMDQQCAVSCS